jgi:alpha-L-fucosidase
MIIGGIEEKPKSAKLAVSGKSVDISMTGLRLILSGLPVQPPDMPVTVIELEFDLAPIQNSTANRIVYAVLGDGPEA